MSMPYIIFHHSFTEDELDGWTWLKWPAIPPEDDRTVIKDRYQARFSRKRLAWYIKQYVPAERLAEVLGQDAEGVIVGQRPIKRWPKGFRSA